jgi:single-strand DNA-binding protein
VVGLGLQLTGDTVAQDINIVALVARLTSKPELKGNNNVLPMRLAFTTRSKVGESWEDVPNYVDAVVYGRQAEVLAPMLDKGSRVGINGQLRWQEWTGKDGQKNSRVQIAVNNLQLLSAPQERRQQSSPPIEQIVSDAAQNLGATVVSDDVPF